LPSPAAIRDFIESLVLILAWTLIARAFAVEAFVIPTGSMAPTLMGRHKDVQCPQCGYGFQVGAGDELDETGQPTGFLVFTGTCPMCRFTMDLSRDNTLDRRYPSYSGDRILVNKFIYGLRDPERWDVAVFRYPLRAQTNFIKRIAGLPNETVRIQYGDVWIKPERGDRFEIARKPPAKILATMQPVYDNDYVLSEQVRKGWPMRWAPMEPDTAGGWVVSEDLKSFQTKGTASEEVWLAYRHTVPTYQDWAYRMGVWAVEPAKPKAQLITDFTAYDTGEGWSAHRFADRRPPEPLPGGFGQPPDPSTLGLNWVGDLMVDFEINATGNRGEVVVDLVKGGQHFLCRLDLAQGTVGLAIRGVDAFRPTSSAGIRGPGTHRVRFANVDQQLVLWLDGRVVSFDQPTTYDASIADTTVPNRDDLEPVRIGSRDAAVEVRHLKVLRDIYYIAQQVKGEAVSPGIPTDLDPTRSDYPFQNRSPDRVPEFFSSPSEWNAFRYRRDVEFQLAADQFFMLGDNSPMSKDSRLWDAKEFYVNRDLLMGETVVLYWPHAWHRIPGTPIPFPFFPNFSRMGLVR
jgi:signal peptidase I